MSLFDQLGNNPRASLPDRAQVQKYASQLRNNPLGFLQNLGYNVPNGIDVNNPNSIINFLIQSKQVNGGLLGIAQQLMGMLR